MRTAVIAAVLCSAPFAFAQSVNIDLGHANPNPTAPPSAIFPGAAAQAGHWMNVPTALTTIQVDGLDGLPSGITLTRTSGNVSTFSVNNPATTGDHEALLDDFHGFSSLTTVTYQFTGVDPGAYTLYTYAIAPDNAAFRTVVNVSGSSSTNPQVVGGAMPVDTFVPGVTHAAHDLFVGPDGIINITLTGGGSAGSINGFQLRQGDAELAANIQSPSAFACGCSIIDFVGTATGPGGIDAYTIEVAPSSTGPWTQVAAGTNPVVNDELGSWITSSYPQDDYLIRMTVTGLDSSTTTGVSAVFVDRQPPVATFANVTPSIVLGGAATVHGTATDRCFTSYALQYSLPGAGAFTPVDPAHAISTTPAQNAPLGTWNTTAIANGTYDLRILSTDSCGNQSTFTQPVIIDNTPPVATISQPTGAFDLCGFVPIVGVVDDTNLDQWTLEYTNTPSSAWLPIASGATNVTGTLASWDTTGLPRGAYTLRLTAVDRATDLSPGGLDGHTTTFLRSIDVGRSADINNDGQVNSADLSVFLANFGASCF